MKKALMKTPLLAVLAVLVLTTVSAWSQSDSVADAARQNQQKKASHVIDDENIGSALANTRDVQSATATSEPEPEKDAKDAKIVSELAGRDQKAATPKDEVERQRAKKQKWLDTIEICKKKLENAQTDMQRDIWTENLASAEDGLSKTRKDLANAEQELQDSEQGQTTQPAPPAAQSGNSPEQSETGTAPQ
jgi:hypothetical protein